MSILSERRSFQPYGLEGGHPGKRGLNLLKIISDGSNRTISLGGKNTVSVNKGDRLQIHTPGGGGFGHLCLAPEAVMTAFVTPQNVRMTAGSLNQYVLNQESV